MRRRPDLAWRATGALALIWLGILIGVDLVAAPAPFRAEALGRSEALVVNRELFALMSWTELVMLGLTVAAAALAGRRFTSLLVPVALAAVVALQALWLLPALSARTDLVLAGGDPGPAPFHALYVGLEGAKAILLVGLALTALRRG